MGIRAQLAPHSTGRASRKAGRWPPTTSTNTLLHNHSLAGELWRDKPWGSACARSGNEAERCGPWCWWTWLLAIGLVRGMEEPGVWLQHSRIILITAIFLLEQKYFITFNLEPGTNYACVVWLTINLPLLTADTYLHIYLYHSHGYVSRPKKLVKILWIGEI